MIPYLLQDGSLVNPFDSTPIKVEYFETILKFACQRDITLSDKLGIFIKEGKVEQEFQFKGSTKCLEIRRKEFLLTVQSPNKIPDESSSYSSNSYYADDEDITYLQKFQNIGDGVSGVLFDVPPTVACSRGNDIITFGPYFTLPHRDELLVGGATLMPSWNRGVIKIWIFSTSSTIKHDRLMLFRTNVSIPLDNVRNLIAKELIDLLGRGYACAVFQLPGQVLIFPEGHCHAVLTAFSTAEVGTEQVCLMSTRSFVDKSSRGISLANRMLKHSHLNTVIDSSFEIAEMKFKEFFSKKMRDKYTKRTRKSALKKKQTLKTKTEMINAKIKKMNEARLAKMVEQKSTTGRND